MEIAAKRRMCDITGERIIVGMITVCSRRVAIRHWIGCCALLALGCSGGVDVTPESLAQARNLWDRAGIKDYRLEWTSSGVNEAHYRVDVHGGQVRSIAMVQPDGQSVPVHPAETQYYGVEGLFLTMANELAQLKTPTPFGCPKGSQVLLKFLPDPKLGYPRRYRRDVVGASRGVAIDVIQFEPIPLPDDSSSSR